jgi:hypothetical protein
MMETARKLRERMEKVHSGQFLFFQMIQQVLPILDEAVLELRASLAARDAALPGAEASLAEAERALAKLADQVRAIKEATEMDRAAVARVAAGLARFVEEYQLQRERMHETAALATLQQYYEVAAQASVLFWLELLGLVELPTYEAAMIKFASQNPAQFEAMLAAAQRAGATDAP